MLCSHFLERFGPGLTLSTEALQLLMAYSWPGNVRELKNIIERLVILTTGTDITVEMLPSSLMKRSSSFRTEQVSTPTEELTFKDARDEFEKEFILQKLAEYDWNVSRTAEAIDMERSNLHRKIKAYGIELKKS